MSDDGGRILQMTFDEDTMRMLEACAAWRNVSLEELVKAYVEDWIDVDYPEFAGSAHAPGHLP